MKMQCRVFKKTQWKKGKGWQSESLNRVEFTNVYLGSLKVFRVISTQCKVLVFRRIWPLRNIPCSGTLSFMPRGKNKMQNKNLKQNGVREVNEPKQSQIREAGDRSKTQPSTKQSSSSQSLPEWDCFGDGDRVVTKLPVHFCFHLFKLNPFQHQQVLSLHTFSALKMSLILALHFC